MLKVVARVEPQPLAAQKFDFKFDNNSDGTTVASCVDRSSNQPLSRFLLDGGVDCSQSQWVDLLYLERLHSLVVSAVSGRKSTVVTFGSDANSGRHWLYEGDKKDGRSLLRLAVENCFGILHQHAQQTESFRYKLSFSCAGIINDNIVDLARPQARQPPAMAKSPAAKIKLDKRRPSILNGVAETTVTSADEVLSLIQVVRKNSRASPPMHHLYTLYVETSTNMFQTATATVPTGAHGVNLPVVGQLCVLSLGENVSIPKSVKGLYKIPEDPILSRFPWAAPLVYVISSMEKRLPSIPFHKSKLTALLKDSITSRCSTVFLISLCGAEHSYKDSLAALNLAHRIRTSAIESYVLDKATTSTVACESVLETSREEEEQFHDSRTDLIHLQAESIEPVRSTRTPTVDELSSPEQAVFPTLVTAYENSQQEVTVLKQTVQHLNQERDSLANQVDELAARLSGVVDRYEHLQRLMIEQKAEEQRTVAEDSQSNGPDNSNKKLRKVTAEYQRYKEVMEMAVTRMQKEAEQQEEEKTALKRQLRERESLFRRTQREAEEKEKQIQKQNRKIQIMEEERSRFGHQTAQQLAQMRTDCDHLNDQVNMLIQARSEIDQELQEARRKIVQTESEPKLRMELQNLQAQLHNFRQVQQRVDSLERELNQREDQLRSEIAVKERLKRQLDRTIEESVESKRQQEQMYAELKSKYELTLKENESLRIENAAIKQSKRSLAEETSLRYQRTSDHPLHTDAMQRPSNLHKQAASMSQHAVNTSFSASSQQHDALETNNLRQQGLNYPASSQPMTAPFSPAHIVQSHGVTEYVAHRRTALIDQLKAEMDSLKFRPVDSQRGSIRRPHPTDSKR
eukprot:GILK01011232.1.p1 GENE.GILK01011232.1~~GILK01011232.1.p1  ORF type:complete len:856 (-),score=197.25 GILK01011232.1:35-2602(-)